MEASMSFVWLNSLTSYRIMEVRMLKFAGKTGRIVSKHHMDSCSHSIEENCSEEKFGNTIHISRELEIRRNKHQVSPQTTDTLLFMISPLISGF
jgi:hypothetical protein